MLRISLLLCAVLAVPPLRGQQPPTPAPPQPRSLQAARVTDRPPVLDGRLDDPIWRGAGAAQGFVQHEPSAGAPATQRTEVRVAFDHHAVYVAARLFDTHPDSVVAQLGGQDEELYSDWFYVQLDSDLDRRTAFEFGVNPASVRWDAMIHNDTENDPGWDAVWDAVALRDSAGWSAEIRIPFHQLRFRLPRDTTAVARWGINFRRHVARREETSDWSPIPRNSSRFVSIFGTLQGVRGIRPPNRLEVQPYLVARVTRAPEEAGNPFWRRNDLFRSAGADVKYGLTSHLTLTATFNPDFAEVEADRPYVRLNGDYEPFFPEKRPFFLEGAEIFRFDAQGPFLFHSRSIGGAPREPRLAEGTIADVPESTPILGAAKLSGKIDGGWSVGLLNAVSGEVEARVLETPDALRTQPVEPLTHFAVARVSRDLGGGHSTIGGILTATNRRLDDSSLDHLHSAAYAAGIDFWHRLPGQVEITGMLAGSRVRGSTEALQRLQRAPWHLFQRADAEHLEYDSTRVELGGFTTAISAYRFAGGSWGWAAGAHARSPGFEINDAGYQHDSDVVSQYVYLRYDRTQAGKLFRRWNMDFTQASNWTFGRERLGASAGVNGGFQLTSFWGGSWGASRELSGLHVRMMGGGPALVTPGRSSASFSVYSDHRRRVLGNVSGGGWLDDEGGGYLLRLGSALTFRGSRKLELSIGPYISWYSNPWHLVTWQRVRRGAAMDSVYVVGRIRQTTATLAPRLRYTLNPRLSLQFHAYPFISSGLHSDFKQVVDPHAGRFRDRFHRYTPAEIAYDSARSQYRVDRNHDGRPDFWFRPNDFSYKEIRAQAVLRWDYRPGSTLHVVWRQDRTEIGSDGSFDLGRDAPRLFGLNDPIPVTNRLVVKLSYWLGL